jgi:hypothetical protein
MDFHLVCVHPWGPYKRGHRVTDPQEVDRLQQQRDKHFVRVPAPVSMKAKAPHEINIGGVEYALEAITKPTK